MCQLKLLAGSLTGRAEAAVEAEAFPHVVNDLIFSASADKSRRQTTKTCHRVPVMQDLCPEAAWREPEGKVDAQRKSNI